MAGSSRDAAFGRFCSNRAQVAAAAARQDGEQLVWEVWDVVERDFLDARGTGFDRAQWAAARDAALAGVPPGSAHATVHAHISPVCRHACIRFPRPSSKRPFDATCSRHRCAEDAPRLRSGRWPCVLCSV
jgi:hypothetical protein